MGDRAAAESTVPSFGVLLRAYRLRAGLSQEQLAERAGLSAKAIGAIEQGARRAPYRHTVDLLLNALDLVASERDMLTRAAENARGRAARQLPAESQRAIISIPQLLSSFIDRTEVDDIADLVGKHRLVTVTGSGGVGKTRTAIEAATRLVRAKGVSAAFVDLSALNDSSLIAGQIATVLNVQVSGSDDILGSLIDALESRALLIILDNCEHFVAEAARIVSDLLKRCPSIVLLTTSRENLRLASEVVYRLPSLQVPESSDIDFASAASYSAIALFVQRAQYADAQLVLSDEHVPSIVEICRKLDGIPLAIELVAARLPSIGLETLRTRLRDFFAFSGSRDLPARQQTMLATISWSFDLLNQSERALLERLSIFSGSFTLAAAETVCAEHLLAADEIPELLMRLVEKSLINVLSPGDRTRYTLLESIRTFGLERLRESGQTSAVAQRHAEWFAHHADLIGKGTILPTGWHEEVDNARAAIDWCLNVNRPAELSLAARIAGGMRLLWAETGRDSELRGRALQLLERLDDTAQNYAIIARLWRVRLNTEKSLSIEIVCEARPFLERAGDHEGVAASLADLALVHARMGAFALANTALADAAAYFDKLAAKDIGRAYFVFAITSAWVLSAQGELEGARSRLLTLSALLRRDQDVIVEAYMYNVFAEVEFASGNVTRAVELAEKSWTLFVPSDGLATSVRLNLCCYLLSADDLEGAERIGKMSLAHAWTHQLDSIKGDAAYDVIVIQHLAAIASRRKQPRLAARLLGFIDETYRRSSVTAMPGTEQYSYDVLTTSLARQLSPEELARYRSEGVTLDFRAAAELLLASPFDGHAQQDTMRRAHR
jgi:predicted ATPase/DNA-binding XRE family transcriptional regulator